MTRLLLLISILIAAGLHNAFAQLPTVQADTVYIVATREFPFVKQISTADSLAALPAHWLVIPALSVNAVSLNGLATLSNRGMSSRHTAILFEGIPINGTTTGVADVSLLPFSHFDANKLFKDGIAASFGDHTMGGALMLATKRTRENKLQATIGTSSLYNHKASVAGRLVSKRTGLSVHWEEYHHSNKMPYLKYGQMLTSQSFRKTGRNINADLFFQPNVDHVISGAFWVQQFGRDIPGPYFIDLGQYQKDENYRMALTHHWNHPKIKIKNQLGYFNERLLFLANGVDSDARSQLIQMATTTEWKKRWVAGATFRREVVKANFYKEIKHRNTLMLTAGMKWKMWGGRFQALVSPHFMNGSTTPVNAEFRWEGPMFFGSALRNYNLPGFNDLFWPSGGNVDLKPEKSHQLNLGMSHSLHPHWKIQASVFSYWVDDYIQWIPAFNNIWTPYNLKKVWSRGGELIAEYHRNVYRGQWTIRLQYGFTRTTNLTDHQSSAIGRQLLYVPIHKAGLTAYRSWGPWFINVDVVFMGRRYDSTDNFISLNPFITGIGRGGYKATFRQMTMDVSLSVDNLWKTDYQLIRSYPMPLRSFAIQSSFQYPLQ